MKPIGLAFAFLILLSVRPAFAPAGEIAINIHVASRAYLVSVAPADEESKQAENSVLYQRDADGGAWTLLGDCRKEVAPGGEVRFIREVEVASDGVYLYTSRPVVGGHIARPPTAGSPPQARVVVDTLPPTAEITAPGEGVEVMPGQRVDLVWTSADENLGSLPASLAYSTDSGKSWHPIARDLPRQGETAWTAPDDLAGPAVVRLAAVDLAGNVGRDLRRLDTALPEPKVATIQPPVVVPPPVAAPPPVIAPPAKIVPSVPEKIEPAKIEPAPAAPKKSRDANRSWLYYLMAINLMRQNKPADALQYYWLTVKEDPDFIDAWADIGLAYIDLGAYKTAREVVEQTRDKAPDRIDLMHLLGETYHAEGMALLADARSAEDRAKAKALVDQAVEWYGRALDHAAKEWRLAEQAASFYRLGEVCYYVNLDRDGARAYWKKILELHSPSPNHDLVLWTAASEREKAERRYQRYTYQRVSLEAWQNWARGYLEQLDARERAGIRDLMPAQKISAGARPQPLSYGSNEMNPGRNDGRSLFSLPSQLGSPAPVAASVGTSSCPPSGTTSSSPGYRNPATENYSFYAEKNSRQDRAQGSPPEARSGKRHSLFSGGPDQPPPPNPDPYAFPGRSQGGAPWNGAGPYGDQPTGNW